MHIIRAIKNIIKNNPILFTTPGHVQGFHTQKEFADLFGENIFKGDFAEIEGMDNLQSPKEAVLKSLQRTSEIYNSKASFYLVNGSSSGIIALMLATVKKGEKVLIARNAHKSAINALILSGAYPVWIETEWDENLNIPAAVNAEKIRKKLEEIPDTKAVLITSPTYEGIVTDIKPIAKICKTRKITLLVDEAHGALWNFSDHLPESSIHAGADACIQSLHKTGSCLNQGAILHLSKESGLSPENVQECLNIINTTSPSYILLSSIEASIEYLNSTEGRKKLDNLIKNISWFKNELKQNCDALFLQDCKNYRHDPTKLFFGLKNINGHELSDYLQNKFNIEVELDNDAGLLAHCGIGTTKKHFQKLLKAVIQAEKELDKNYTKGKSLPLMLPKTALTPVEAFNRDFKTIKLDKAIGLISKELIIKYPPGIPLLIPGEIIQQQHIGMLKEQIEIEIII